MVARLDSPPTPQAKAKAAPPKPAAGTSSARSVLKSDALVLAAKPTAGQPLVGTSYALEKGKLTTRNTVLINAEPERVMAAIEGDWSQWFAGSAVKATTGAPGAKLREGETRFRFEPTAGKGEAFEIQQYAAEAAEAGKGQIMMVIPTRYVDGPVKGDGRYEVRVTSEGKTLLTSTLRNVDAGDVKKAEAFAKAHLARETKGLAGLGAFIEANP